MLKEIYACELCKSNCMGCFYSDYCGDWNCSNDPIPKVLISTDTATLELCEGRHKMPKEVEGAIFNNSLNPLAVNELENEAYSKLRKLDIKRLNLYVTVLTVALIAVLNACRNLQIKVVLYHYDQVNDSYYKQEVE